MLIQTLAGSPRNERGGGQVSYLLLAEGQFGASELTVTWVEAAPNSEQPLHDHPDSEQVYVIVQGQGRMTVGDEVSEVTRGMLIFVPPRTRHAIQNIGTGGLIYVSATSPPFHASIDGQTWRPA
jgi:mannose-6-phosphate isomerase-like protein (cupin superfamily)